MEPWFVPLEHTTNVELYIFFKLMNDSFKIFN